MTKSISAALSTHLASEVTTLATCWKITLGGSPADIRTFTDHDRDIVFEGLTYEAESGYSASAVETSAALNVDNLNVEGILSSPSITEADLNAGLWDYAAVEIFKVNWNDLSQGALKLRRGTLGEVTAKRSQFVAELRGLMQAYTRNIGELYQPACRTALGDERCTQNLTDYTTTASVTAITSARQFTTTLAAQTVRLTPTTTGAPSADYFKGGLLTWTAGLNAGLEMEVKTYSLIGSPTVGEIQLHLPMSYAIAVNDTFRVHAGCDKAFSTCIAKFGNAVNFRGHPHLPGLDKVLKIGGQ